MVTALAWAAMLVGAVQADTQLATDFGTCTRASRTDLMEVCCPEDSPLSEAVQKENGTIYRCGLWNGHNMATKFSYTLDADGKTFQNLNILERSGDLQIVYPSETRDSAEILELFVLLLLLLALTPL